MYRFNAYFSMNFERLPMKLRIAVLAFFYAHLMCAQDRMPYQLFDANGNQVSYKKLLHTSQNSEVLLFGEFHDNPIAHWLELELTKDLAQKRELVLGAEMIESDNQGQLNSYLNGDIDQKKLDSTARLWPNYKTDYKQLVDFAKEKKFSFVATNIPRRYASLVFKEGFEALDKLSTEEKNWMAPLPILYDESLAGYAKMRTEIAGHESNNLPKAQAIKDATMAYFIDKNKKEHTLFIHFNGSYHSDNYEGIYWYLRKLQPNIKIVTIATVTQNQVEKLEKEHYNKADFILVIDQDVTTSY